MNEKIKRKLFKTFINTTKGTGEAAYEVLGTDLEEFNIEMNANVVKQSNILGETSTSIDKYEKQASVEPYKAISGTGLYARLKAIVDEEQTLDDLKTDIVNVDLMVEGNAGAYPAYKEEGIIEVVSYGGNTEGFQIPFNIHLTGVRTKGTFNPTTKKFTPTI